jgi:Uma2 family endonuclease
MGNPTLAPDERFTYRHYRTWPDEERWELIEGHAWAMSPTPIRPHQKLSMRLSGWINSFLEGKPCEVYAAPFDVLFPESDEPDDEIGTVVQPDILVICDKSKLTRSGARGAPDWVIEILSPRTAKKDFEVKHRLYERHGVREYWIVDPGAAVIHAWRLGKNEKYGEETIYEDGEAAPSSVLNGLVIDTKKLFADLD